MSGERYASIGRRGSLISNCTGGTSPFRVERIGRGEDKVAIAYADRLVMTNQGRDEKRIRGGGRGDARRIVRSASRNFTGSCQGRTGATPESKKSETAVGGDTTVRLVS